MEGDKSDSPATDEKTGSSEEEKEATTESKGEEGEESEEAACVQELKLLCINMFGLSGKIYTVIGLSKNCKMNESSNEKLIQERESRLKTLQLTTKDYP